MITIIVPVFNEQENIIPLIEEITAASITAPITEIVYVDDGSTDDTYKILTGLQQHNKMLRLFRHRVCSGQSAAFMTGARAASNKLIVFMDGDGQNNPADVAQLYAVYAKNEKEFPKLMVAGQRSKRQDNLLRRLSSRLANRIREFLLKDGTRDTGCSLKLIRREDYIALPYFKHMHRYLPALLMRDQVKIFHADVSHRARMRGVSKYGFWNRFWVGIMDLLGVMWLKKRGLPEGFAESEIAVFSAEKDAAP